MEHGCAPGVPSTLAAMFLMTAWIISLCAPLVRTPLPYTPTLLPDNFTVYTAYTLLDSHAEYGAWGYQEGGTVLKEQYYQDKTRNNTFSYTHSQPFTGVTCTYHVHTVVTGYSKDATPLGNVYPQLTAPGCGAAVAFRALLITLLVLPFLTACLAIPGPSIRTARNYHTEYLNAFVVLNEADNRRAEGHPPAPHDSPPSSPRRSVPPPYNQPGYTINVPDLSAQPAPLVVGGVLFHAEAPQSVDHAEPNPPPAYQPPAQLPRAPRGPRRYLPQANVETAQRKLRSTTRELRSAILQTVCGLSFAVIALGIAIGTLGCLLGFVYDSGFGEQRQLLWPVWLHLSTISFYVMLVIIECMWVLVPLGDVVRSYLREDGTSWRALLTLKNSAY